MKKLRTTIPFLGILALIVLFLQLPETPTLRALGCKTCATSDPFLPLIGAAYFSLLIGVCLLFPRFPNRLVAGGGFVWALLLAAGLTYMGLPNLCISCLIAHGCHILMWVFWILASPLRVQSSPLRERVYALILAPIAVVALFSCLNLTFMAYSFKPSRSVASPSLQIGAATPAFNATTIGGRLVSNRENIVINFLSSDCPHCKEQLLVLNVIAAQLPHYRFVNITPASPSPSISYSSNLEWVIDAEGALRKLFKVSGHPTLFVIDKDKISQIIPGVPENLKSALLNSLQKMVADS